MTGTRSAQEGKATGAIVFHAFPQEALDKLLEETGGRPIQLHLPELPDGEIVFEDSGNVYRVERIQLENGQVQERRIFLFRLTEQGNIILDGVQRRFGTTVRHAGRIGRDPEWHSDVLESATAPRRAHPQGQGSAQS